MEHAARCGDFRQALDVWRHPFWEENAVDDLDAYVDFVLGVRDAGHAVKLGIEMDFVPGREEQIAALLEGRPWDYVIGSVHFIADRAVDHEGHDAWRASEPDEVWTEYFSTLGDAAASGLFDVLAHPDLVKVWGAGRAAPSRPARVFYELALEGICAADVAIEVSTAGLRKPVGLPLAPVQNDRRKAILLSADRGRAVGGGQPAQTSRPREAEGHPLAGPQPRQAAGAVLGDRLGPASPDGRPPGKTSTAAHRRRSGTGRCRPLEAGRRGLP